MLKESIHQKEIIILNEYKANDKALEHIKQKLTALSKKTNINMSKTMKGLRFYSVCKLVS